MDADFMPCPACDTALEPTPSKHGIVWLCNHCRSGAATLPVLRQVAPRAFVQHLWQAALHDGLPSPKICPSCTQPFTTFSGSRVTLEPNLEVCVRCYWVWLGPASLSALSQLGEPPSAARRIEKIAATAALTETTKAMAEARGTLAWLAGRVILSLLR